MGWYEASGPTVVGPVRVVVYLVLHRCTIDVLQTPNCVLRRGFSVPKCAAAKIAEMISVMDVISTLRTTASHEAGGVKVRSQQHMN